MTPDPKKPIGPRGDPERNLRPNDKKLERDESNRDPKADLKKKLGKRH